MRYHHPVDPDCPKVREFYDTILDDPMTEAMGAPVDDIFEDFDRKHVSHCRRCQEYGCANIEVM